MLGQVKWFDPIRAYGFIYCEDLGTDIFVHAADIIPGEDGLKVLRQYDCVEFDFIKEVRGLKAKSVKRTRAGSVEDFRRESLRFKRSVTMDEPETTVTFQKTQRS